MYNFHNQQEANQILKALKVLRDMPNHLIMEGGEDQYRKETLEQFGVTEESITLFIDMNELSGLSLAEHLLDLREKANEFKSEFRQQFTKLLLQYDDEDDKLDFLKENDCNYSRWAFESDIWQRYARKSFKEFAQWHIEQGGWQSDFQGLIFEAFARSWALSWMDTWINQQITEIQVRRVRERRPTVINQSHDRTSELLGVREKGKSELWTEEFKQEQLMLELEDWRRKFIREKHSCRKSSALYGDNGPGRILFIVEPLDLLKDDLEQRLANAIRKEDLLKKELEKISSDINDTQSIFVDINSLRRTLDTSRPIDLSQFEERLFGTGMEQLAIYWDIVHYEYYLKNRIATLNAGPESTEGPYSISPPPTIIKAPTLYINPSTRQALYDALIPFVDENQHGDLMHLLHQKTATDKIAINHQQNSIAYVFRQAIEAGHCGEEKTRVRDWILYWFRVIDGKNTKLLTSGTVYDALTKDKKPARNKRIPYNP